MNMPESLSINVRYVRAIFILEMIFTISMVISFATVAGGNMYERTFGRQQNRRKNMERERMTITTAEYKQLLESKIRMDLLWQRCLKMKHEDDVNEMFIDEIQFILNADDNYDPFCGLPMEDVPQRNFDLHEDGRN
jgi:hypothetical protein